MAHKVVVQEGYGLPFASFEGYKKSKKKKGKKRGKRSGKNKMIFCAKKWNRKAKAYKKTHKYRAFIRSCMKTC